MLPEDGKWDNRVSVVKKKKKSKQEREKIKEKNVSQAVNFHPPKIPATNYPPTCIHLQGSTEKLQAV